MDSNGVLDGVWDPTWDAAMDVAYPPLNLSYPSTFLGLLGEREVRNLDNHHVPFDPDGPWMPIFTSLSLQQLFILGIRSPSIWEVVMEYVVSSTGPTPATRKLPVFGPLPHYPLMFIGSLPVELCLEIASHLVMLDRARLGATSVFWRDICFSALQCSARDVVSTFELRYADIQFMQAVTSSLLAGACTEYLMGHVPSELYVDTVDRLQFYCPNGTFDWVREYFLTCTSATMSRWAIEPDDGAMNGASRTCLLDTPNGKMVKLFQSSTQSAMGPLACSQYTISIGALSHVTFWHGHPRSTVDKIILPNQPYVDVSHSFGRSYAMAFISGFCERGYTLSQHYPRKHVCGRDASCPHTLRHSTDNGCLSVSLATVPFPETFGNSRDQLRWFLGARPCSIADPSVLTSSAFGTPDPKYHVWTLRWRALVRAAQSLL
ncbi:hypothetical protein C8R47DRAFT_1226172 [Mycena vitilis]|nr:hypothetical protein C8R47DRAFT_1226172 [Mycena vitilis]